MSRHSKAAPRIFHDEPGFVEDAYTLEYSRQTGKHSGADFEPLIQYVLDNLNDPSDARILDIGAGPGWITIRLAQRHPGIRVTGIDLSDSFLSIANQNKVEAGVADQVAFQFGDARSMLEFDDDSFDAVISNQSLHYWDPPQEVFNEISRILKPSANFCISDDRRDLNWLGKIGVGIGMLVHSHRISRSWKQSIEGSFTPAEVEQLLQDSDLRNCWDIEVGSRMMLITGQVRVGSTVVEEAI